MIGLLQRVNQAQVEIDKRIVGRIDQGILVLVGVEKHDTEQSAHRLLERILGYRIFSDQLGKMNLSVSDVKGGVLLVPQFTLAADTTKGMRPSFSSAAPPGVGEQLFNFLVQLANSLHPVVATGRFGADMQVSLTNDGPVTFLLNT